MSSVLPTYVWLPVCRGLSVRRVSSGGASCSPISRLGCGGLVPRPYVPDHPPYVFVKQDYRTIAPPSHSHRTDTSGEGRRHADARKGHEYSYVGAARCQAIFGSKDRCLISFGSPWVIKHSLDSPFSRTYCRFVASKLALFIFDMTSLKKQKRIVSWGAWCLWV